MTAKEKAKELVDRFKEKTTYEYQEYAGANYSTFEHDTDTLKQCALICVDEMQKVCNGLENWQYLEEIKQELEKL
jgi:hypothetical protein